ncbi:glutathione S-transferase family protein [Aspergillus stella-maris]|uniref:glutathione S-transferase family protein n=1 Tax=Aspergillus stella-maris TaxID=1810926 RepID=UPI003CCCE675
MTPTNLNPLALHAHTTGPNPFKVALVLESLSIPYTVKLWTFDSDDHGVKGPRFLSINPNGRVPALQDPNTEITSWESMACINYLLRVYDRDHKLSALDGSMDLKRAVQIDSWTSFLITTLGPMMGQCNWFRHYNAVKNDDAYGRYQAQAYRCFGVLEGQLRSHGAGEGGWILEGAEPSVVDWHFEPWVRQFEFAGLDLREYPLVKAWLDRVQTRPEVVRAYEKVKGGEEQ